MADFTKAVEFLLSNETFTRKGVVVSRYENPTTGEISNWGISLKWLKTIDPEATADTVRNLTRGAAVDLYFVHWWKANHLDLLDNDNLAAKMLDICVNCGAGTGIKLLQQALNEPLENPATHLAVDGVIGPKVAAVAKLDTATSMGEYGLLAALVSLLEDHYRNIVEANPVHEADLATWLARAEKLPVTA